jgi:hypothetical protein
MTRNYFDCLKKIEFFFDEPGRTIWAPRLFELKAFKKLHLEIRYMPVSIFSPGTKKVFPVCGLYLVAPRCEIGAFLLLKTKTN